MSNIERPLPKCIHCNDGQPPWPYRQCFYCNPERDENGKRKSYLDLVWERRQWERAQEDTERGLGG